MKPTKVLAGFIMDGKAGGVDRYLLNFANRVCSENVQVDFLTNRLDSGLQKMLESYNSELYEVANLKQPQLQYRQICDLITKNQYDATYFNISTAISRIGPKAAYDCKVPIRAIHSHSTGNDCSSALKRKMLDYLHNKYKKQLYKMGNRFYACSKTAGLWLFPQEIVNSDRFRVIHNAIDAQKFSYDLQQREQVRAELGLQGGFVVGHVGNFCYQKNYPMLLEITKALVAQNDKAILLSVGTGSDFESVKEAAYNMGLEKNIRFLGQREDVSRLMQAMDVFVLPSHFEGLALVAIEAQAAGLPCVFSTGMTEEAKITDEVTYLSVQDSAQKWAQVILGYEQHCRQNTYPQMVAAGYDLAGEKEAYLSIVT